LQQERRPELVQVGQMCELLERRLRFMTVRDSEQYTVPSLELLERNLEAAMYKVRCEKDRKIGGEISYLENIVRVQKNLSLSTLGSPKCSSVSAQRHGCCQWRL
jgi:MADS-box transcription factor, plant